MIPLYVVGDVHGCYDEMMEMLRLICVDAEGYDKYVVCFVGDYVDRGPKENDVLCEIMKLKLATDNEPLGKDHYVFLKGNHEEMLLMQPYRFADLPVGAVEFLRELPTWYRHFVGDGRSITVAHAGLDPTIPIDLQADSDLVWSRTAVGYHGEYDDTDLVVYGHTPLVKILERPHQIGLDTGCVFGGTLSAVRLTLSRGEIERKFFQVPAKSTGWKYDVIG